MAILDSTTRQKIFAEAMERNREPFGALKKADLKAAVDAIDQWIEDNAVSFNQAIPQPARSELTVRQKVLLFLLCVTKRFEV